MSKTTAHYGSWRSPITADLITAKTISPVEVIVDGEADVLDRHVHLPARGLAQEARGAQRARVSRPEDLLQVGERQAGVHNFLDDDGVLAARGQWKGANLREARGVGGFIMYLVQAFMNLFETMISQLSNTLSFVRVGAFAVAHGGVSMAIFATCGLISSTRSASCSWETGWPLI